MSQRKGDHCSCASLKAAIASCQRVLRGIQGGWAGTGDAELLPRGQRPPLAAADVPNVGGYRDGPEGGGLVAAAIGGGRRAAQRPSSAEV